jgi:hypothetical protein
MTILKVRWGAQRRLVDELGLRRRYRRALGLAFEANPHDDPRIGLLDDSLAIVDQPALCRDLAPQLLEFLRDARLLGRIHARQLPLCLCEANFKLPQLPLRGP